MMIDIKFELDIPSLTEHGIQMDDLPFWYVKELNSSSMIDLSIIIKMLILLIDSFDRRVALYQRSIALYTNKLIVFVDNE